MKITNSEGSYGNYVSHTKYAVCCFDVGESEQVKYVTYAPFGVKDVYDSNALGEVEL